MLPKDLNILFLDDERHPQDVFGQKLVDHDQVNIDVARDYDEFISLVENKLETYHLVSFDHDIGEEGENERTGKDAAYAMLEHAMVNDKKLPKFSVHSSNPAADKIIRMLEKYAVFMPIKELKK